MENFEKEISKMKEVLVETSARHIHLSREAVDVLFGAGYELTKRKDLSQPGQYACAEKLEVVGPKGKLKASILGPILAGVCMRCSRIYRTL